jgi:uncharacterized Zn finger protein
MNDQTNNESVGEGFACPNCNETNADNLVCNENNGLVTCLECGHVYDPLGTATDEEIEAEELRLSNLDDEKAENTVSELYGEQMDMS